MVTYTWVHIIIIGNGIPYMQLCFININDMHSNQTALLFSEDDDLDNSVPSATAMLLVHVVACVVI